MDVHLRDLRYFVAVADELSFTAAAARLHVSQPGLSKQVRQLERDLRATLLHREPRGVRLTVAGAALLPEARRLVEAWAAVTREVRAADAADRGELRVGLQTGIGRGLYPAAVHRFAGLRPGVRPVLGLRGWDDGGVGLLDGHSDVAIAWLPLPDGVDHQVLVTEPRLVAFHCDHRLADKEMIDVADLLDEPFVAPPETAGPMREFWLAIPERHGHPVRIGAEAATPDEAFEAVAAGLGVHLVAAGNAALYRRASIACRLVTGVPPAQLVVAWRHGDRRGPVRDFVTACVEGAAGLPALGDAPDAGDA